MVKKYLTKNRNKLKQKLDTNYKKINLGIQLLRMICSFFIILCHFYNFAYYRIILDKNSYYLTLFFILSFYYSYNTYCSRNISKIKLRFKRMIIPYIIWPLLIYIKDIYNHLFYNTTRLYDLKRLYYQILVGCKIYGIFWFLFVLILLSLFFTVIIFLFKKHYLLVLFIITSFVYYLFYSNYINIFFEQYNKVPCHHSIKPNFEFFVVAFTGFYLGSINFINKLYKFQNISFIFSFSFLYFIIKYNTYFRNINFFYEGIIRDVIVICFIIYFSMFPFDKINNNYVYGFLNKITSHTGGIYYIHVIIGNFSSQYFIQIRNRSFKGCILLYIFCYIICFLGSFILKKYDLKYLFI